MRSNQKDNDTLEVQLHCYSFLHMMKTYVDFACRESKSVEKEANCSLAYNKMLSFIHTCTGKSIEPVHSSETRLSKSS